MKFIGIGIGPGDSSLLTLRAVECIRKIDVLIAPASEKSGKSHSVEIVKKFLNPATKIITAFFPMLKDSIRTYENL